MSNIHDISRNAFMLQGPLAEQGYDWWWHSFTARHAVTGKERAFFIEFYTCNPALGTDVPVLGQLEENRQTGRKPSYVMVKAGTWGEDAVQLHRFFSWSEASVSSEVPFSVSAADCFLSETETRGSIFLLPQEVAEHPEYMCGSGSIRWDLTIRKDIAFHVGYGASEPLRASNAFEMYWHAEGMKTFYEGEVWFNGERYLVTPDTCYGYADKNWGRDFTSPWVWLSSNHLISMTTGKELKNSVFNIGGGRPKIGPFALERKLLSQFTYEGKDYEFNFSKFWTLTATRFDCRELQDSIYWHVEQKTPLTRMVTDITCQKKDMLLINYESPDGCKRHDRLWNGGNGTGYVSLYQRHGRTWVLIDRVKALNIGCEYGEYSTRE